MLQRKIFLLGIAGSMVVGFGCSAENGADGKNCTVVQQEDGSALIRCPDGSEAQVHAGKDGADGAAGKDGLDGKDGQDGKHADVECELIRNEDGTRTLRCGEESIVLGDDCADGFHGTLLVAPSVYTYFKNLGCTRIRGDLILPNWEQEELSASLKAIEEIDGNLIVEGTSLVTVEFPQLRKVGRTVRFEGNHSIQTISFPVLESVGGDLRWIENGTLESAGTFPALKSVAGEMIWSRNAALDDIGSFPALVQAGGMEWSHNQVLASIPDFCCVDGLERLAWENNPRLTTVGKFESLLMVEGPIAWVGNERLEDMGEFPELGVANEFVVRDNPSLEALRDFPRFENVGNLTVTGNASLESIEGLMHLQYVWGDFTFADNEALEDCYVVDLLDSLRSVYDGIDGDVHFEGSCI